MTNKTRFEHYDRQSHVCGWMGSYAVKYSILFAETVPRLCPAAMDSKDRHRRIRIINRTWNEEVSNIETFWHSTFPFVGDRVFHLNEFHSNLYSNRTSWLVNSAGLLIQCVFMSVNSQILGFIIESMPECVFGNSTLMDANTLQSSFIIIILAIDTYLHFIECPAVKI